jgi:hypothetical protein
MDTQNLNQKIEQELTQEDAQTLASLLESKYWRPLKRLKEVLEADAFLKLKDYKRPDAELRVWQGFCGGLNNLIDWAEAIAQQSKKQSHE